MSLRDTIKAIINEQGIDAIKKTSFIGMLDDYGAFEEESPAVREIFRKLFLNGYIAKISSISIRNKSWSYDIENIVCDVSNKYGYQNEMVSKTLKEVALGLNIITSEKDWNVIAERFDSISMPANTSFSAASYSNSSMQSDQKKKSFWNFLKFGGSDEFKIKKYVDEKTGFIIPKLDALSLSFKIPEFEQYADLAEANYLLGLIYFEGKGVDVDYNKAFAYFKTAANAGYSYAQNMLGFCYERGTGISSDVHEAMQWYYKAAVQKLRLATRNLGFLYHNMGNDSEALLWLSKAADKNDVDAMFMIAEIYYRGKSGIKNDKKALKYYSAAATAYHHVQSMYMLGVMISQGQGIDKNPEYAAHYFEKAAEKGHIEAQYALGCYYWEEWRTLPSSYFRSEEQREIESELTRKAYYWLKTATENGHKNAKVLFDKIHWHGLI